VGSVYKGTALPSLSRTVIPIFSLLLLLTTTTSTSTLLSSYWPCTLPPFAHTAHSPSHSLSHSSIVSFTLHRVPLRQTPVHPHCYNHNHLSVPASPRLARLSLPLSICSSHPQIKRTLPPSFSLSLSLSLSLFSLTTHSVQLVYHTQQSTLHSVQFISQHLSALLL